MTDAHDAARRRTAGFTLIEMLVVVVVIALLATLVGPSILKSIGDAKTSTAKSQVQLLATSLDAYYLDMGTYPTSAEGLAALREPPPGKEGRWKGPYLKGSVPQDPWGQAYVYRYPAQTNARGYDLVSLGEDGRPGGEGDAADIAVEQ
jgi:general secretion pathway protein G